MFTRILIVLAFTLSLTGCQTTNQENRTQAADVAEFKVDRINDDLSFRLWFTFYYKYPQPDMIPQAVAYMSQHGYLSDFPDVSSGFLAQVFAAHPEYLQTWLADFDELEPREWNAILAALFLSGSNEARTLLTANLSRVTPDHQKNFKTMSLKANNADNLLGMSIIDPRQINVLWAAFSATGDRRYVERVIEHIQWYDTEANSLQSVIAEAALMTLANNSMQHEIVIETVTREHKNNPNPRVRVMLQAMLGALAEVAEELQMEQQDRPMAH